MAPVARLMIPEPRYVMTTAIAIPAITAPASEAEQHEENDVLHDLLGARGGRAVMRGDGSRGYGTHPSGGPTKPPASSHPASAPLYL